MESELLFPCPAFPTAGGALAERIAKTGLRAVFADVPLLHDRDDSTAWQDWSRAAGQLYAPKRNHLVIPDPNVRVQAVIDGQGVALNDALVADDIAAGRLTRVSQVGLEEYGYYLVFLKADADVGRRQFQEWIVCAGAGLVSRSALALNWEAALQVSNLFVGQGAGYSCPEVQGTVWPSLPALPWHRPRLLATCQRPRGHDWPAGPHGGLRPSRALHRASFMSPGAKYGINGSLPIRIT